MNIDPPVLSVRTGAVFLHFEREMRSEPKGEKISGVPAIVMRLAWKTKGNRSRVLSWGPAQ